MGDDRRGSDGLNDRVATWVRERGAVREVSPGEVVEHPPGDDVCLLLNGWLMRSRRLPDARSATLAVYLPGDIVLLDTRFGAPGGDELIALGGATLVCRSGDEFEAMIDSDTAFARAILRRLAEDAVWLREGLAAVGGLDAQERMVTFLYQTHARLTFLDVIAQDARHFAIPMTQGQLGDAIGVTSVHVNRVLAALRRAGVLTLSGGIVEVSDWSEFRRIGTASSRA